MLIHTVLQYEQSLYSFDFDGNWSDSINLPHNSAGMLATHRTALFAPNFILIYRTGGRWSKMRQTCSIQVKLASIELRSYKDEIIERGGQKPSRTKQSILKNHSAHVWVCVRSRFQRKRFFTYMKIIARSVPSSVGPVISLHGTSGVGKTLTAESIAKATGNSLLKVSVADLGTKVTKVEQKLDIMFQLATAWEAILLFDEADILLEARAIKDNLVRNSIVSVFLKILEYYEGILFLKTNRIKPFDIVVHSRMNLGVHFAEMGEKQEERLLTMFLDMIDERQIKNNGKILGG